MKTKILHKRAINKVPNNSQLDNGEIAIDYGKNTERLFIKNNNNEVVYTEIKPQPTKVSELTNDSGYLTSHQSLSNYYTKSEINTSLNNKVDKIDGKGLSTNDYTTTEKNKLAGIESGAQVNPTSLPANGGNSSTVNGHTVNSDVPSGAKFTDTTYMAGTNVEINSNNQISACKTKMSVATGVSGQWFRAFSDTDYPEAVRCSADFIMPSAPRQMKSAYWTDIDCRLGGLTGRTIRFKNPGYPTLPYMNFFSRTDGDETDTDDTTLLKMQWQSNDEDGNWIGEGADVLILKKGYVQIYKLVYNELVNASDERLKDIKENYILSLENIANAPLFKFTYNDKSDNDSNIEHVGTSANYWHDICPEIVSTANNYYCLDYAKLGAISSISLAKEVVSLKEEIKQLKEEINILKNNKEN